MKSLSAARRLVLQLAVCAAWTIWTFGITTDLPAMIADVGSYFLGGQFVMLITATVREGQLPWFWAILLAPFVVDASLTLARRIMQGERWLTAHRTHAISY